MFHLIGLAAASVAANRCVQEMLSYDKQEAVTTLCESLDQERQRVEANEKKLKMATSQNMQLGEELQSSALEVRRLQASEAVHAVEKTLKATQLVQLTAAARVDTQAVLAAKQEADRIRARAASLEKENELLKASLAQANRALDVLEESNQTKQAQQQKRIGELEAEQAKFNNLLQSRTEDWKIEKARLITQLRAVSEESRDIVSQFLARPS